MKINRRGRCGRSKAAVEVVARASAYSGNAENPSGGTHRRQHHRPPSEACPGDECSPLSPHIPQPHREHDGAAGERKLLMWQ